MRKDNMRKHNILLVEDTNEGQKYKELIEESLNLYIEVIWVRNKKDAITVVQNNIIEVALLDQRLGPGELGTDVYKSIKKIQKNIVAVMLTGQEHINDISSIIDLNYYKFLQKTDITHLPEAVLDAIAHYNIKFLESKDKKPKTFICKLKAGIYPFIKYKVFLLESKKTEDNYIFEDRWEQKSSIKAGENKKKRTFRETEKSIEVDDQILAELSGKYSFKCSALKNSFLGELSARATAKSKKKVLHSEKKNEDEEISLSIPEIPADVNKDYLLYISFETNRVYEKYVNILELFCPVCKSSILYCVPSYNPLPKIRQRQILVYRDKDKKIIDCGIVNLPMT